MKKIKLRVAEALEDDSYKGIARIDTKIMKELGVKRGDIILIKGKRKTVAIADKSYRVDFGDGIIRMDRVIRKNAKTSIAEYITISKLDFRKAVKVTIEPFEKNIRIKGDLKYELFGRAIVKGDILELKVEERGGKTENLLNIKFIVKKTIPNKPVAITENTQIFFPIKNIGKEDFS